jgi:hypothetical protein
MGIQRDKMLIEACGRGGEAKRSPLVGIRGVLVKME